MPVTDSRSGPGTLTLGATASLIDVSCQISNVRLVPEHNEEDGTPTLCEPAPVPTVSTAWSLQGTAIQDWEKPAASGFVEYCRDRNAQEVPFTWVPNTDIGVSYAGTCQVRAVEIGGDVGVQITTDFEFPVKGEPLRTDGALAA